MTGFRKRREQNKVMRDRRLGLQPSRDSRTPPPAKLPPRPVARLTHLNEELAERVLAEDQEKVLRILKKTLAAATIAQVRQCTALANNMASALTKQGFGPDESLLWAAQAVHAANVADRLTTLKLVPNQLPEPVSPGVDHGHRDAFTMIDWAIENGQTIEQGIENHRAFREAGDLSTNEHHDDAGFHRGAEAAYRDVLATHKARGAPA